MIDDNEQTNDILLSCQKKIKKIKPSPQVSKIFPDWFEVKESVRL